MTVTLKMARKMEKVNFKERMEVVTKVNGKKTSSMALVRSSGQTVTSTKANGKRAK